MIRLFSSHLLRIFTMSKAEQKFYAVRTGRMCGIFFKWSDCEEQIKGFPNARYKKFTTVHEAADFALNNSAGQSQLKSGELKRSRSSSPSDEAGEAKKKAFVDANQDNYIGAIFEDKDGVSVWTDGGCFQNGKKGAQAGIGVFWGIDHDDNVSERLLGRATNNRAEIFAAVKAVEIAKSKGIKNLILHTDSQFLINGITKWIKKWKKNNWTLSTGEPVINKDDFLELDEKLECINTKWVHVKGHSGDASNEAVDLLAKKGAFKSLD